MKPADLSLDTVAHGAIPEKFQHMLAKVLDNIMDANTPWDAKRTISITVTFRPTEDRRRMDVDAEVVAKLASMKSDSGMAFIGQRDGEIVAVTLDPEQPELFGDPNPDVHPIPRAQAQGA